MYSYKTEITRTTSITRESQVVSCNFSNAIIAFKGNSILVSERIENRQYKNFLILKNKWKSETLFLSSSTSIYNNSAYKEIINYGRKSIPWIIRELKKTDDHWFYALSKITGVNPVNSENYGVISKMREDWIKWAEQNNY